MKETNTSNGERIISITSSNISLRSHRFITAPVLQHSGGIVGSSAADDASGASSLNALAERVVTRKLISIIILCAAFMALEIAGGLMANSLAIICDAFHLLSDLGGFAISLAASFLARREATRKMNFGFRRLEILGAFSSIIFIWLITGALVYLAVQRIVSLDYDIDARLMIGMASLGVLFNALMAVSLSCKHSHALPQSYQQHSHSLSPPQRSSVFLTPRIVDDSNVSHHCLSENNNNNSNNNSNNVLGSSSNIPPTAAACVNHEDQQLDEMVSRNINIRAAFIHVVGDIIQSLGVLIASLVIYVQPAYKVADPICTIVFSLIVVATTVPILVDIVNVLAESFPRQLNFDELTALVAAMPGVKRVVRLQAWYITTDVYALNLCLLVDAQYQAKHNLSAHFLDSLVAECKLCVTRAERNFKHINIEIDFGELALNGKESLVSLS